MNGRLVSRSGPSRWSVVVASLAMIGGAMVAEPPIVAAAGNRTCAVTNLRTGQQYGPGGGWALRAAIDGARAGTTLEIRGRCVGRFLIDHRLSLVGVGSRQFPVATLVGVEGAATLTVGPVTASLTTLLITHEGVVADTAGTGSAQGSRGVLNAGTLTIARSTVAGNTADVGGGILNTGTLHLVRSTVSSNSAGHGGGIHNAGNLDVVFSTISENSSSGDGGGISSEQMLTLSHSTVARNSTAWVGGGVFVTGPTRFEASIVSANLAGASGPDCAGEVTSNGYNVVFTTDGGYCAIASAVGDQIGGGADPLVGDLADHGGTTLTMALPAGSIAIDTIPTGALGADGITELCPMPRVPDQRGVRQPQGDACDTGAFERRV